MTTDCLDYRVLPGQNPLFSRFLYQPETVEAWYGPEMDQARLVARATEIDESRRNYPREDLALILSPFNQALGASPATLKAIDDLAQPDSIAVVTGQQVGLFGGPALSVYKALTAIQLASLLREQGFRAVPIFWLASDDSDFDEARATAVVGDDGHLLALTHPREAGNNRMAGTVRLTGIPGLLDQLEAGVQRGEFRKFAMDLLRDCYRPDRSLSEAFGALMLGLFRNRGLVVFDPLLPGVKACAKSVFRTAIEKRERIVDLLLTRNRELQKRGFVPQVQVDEAETLLFRTEGVNRIKFEFKNGNYCLKDRKGYRISREDLLNEVESSPQSFGPNVLLRPIMQDHLFPTAVYVGGPAEIAYFSQIHAIAGEWGINPAVCARQGVTFVDPKARRLLEKYELRVTDVLGATEESIRQRLVSETPARQILDEISNLESALSSHVDNLEVGISRMDPTVADFLKGAQRKMLYQVNRVRNRFINNYAVKSSDIERHCRFLNNSLYPGQHLQERVLNFTQFLIHEGPGLVDRLEHRVQPFCKGHNVLFLSES